LVRAGAEFVFPAGLGGGGTAGAERRTPGRRLLVPLQRPARHTRRHSALALQRQLVKHILVTDYLQTMQVRLHQQTNNNFSTTKGHTVTKIRLPLEISDILSTHMTYF